MVIVPALDLSAGRVAAARDGTTALATRDDDALDRARSLVVDGARWLHVVDLDGARTGDYRNLGLIAAIARATGTPVQLGGSVSDPVLAREALAGRPGNLPGVTGARGLRVLGAIYPR